MVEIAGLELGIKAAIAAGIVIWTLISNGVLGGVIVKWFGEFKLKGKASTIVAALVNNLVIFGTLVTIQVC